MHVDIYIIHSVTETKLHKLSSFDEKKWWNCRLKPRARSPHFSPGHPGRKSPVRKQETHHIRHSVVSSDI